MLEGLTIAAYGRYSSDKQSETSAADQIARIAEYVGARGGQLSPVHIYRDEGISGATERRPGFQALTDAVRAEAIDVLVVEDISRLSRDIAHAHEFRKLLEFRSIRLLSVADGVDSGQSSGKMNFAMRTMFSEMFLADLADKTRRGMRARARAGKLTGAPPYGYRSVPSPDGVGRVAALDEEKAAVVRRVFALRLAGESIPGIAKRLNAEGVPSPRGRQKDSRKRQDGWVQSGVRNMLRNERYVGGWTFGKHRFARNPETGRRTKRAPDAPPIVVQCPELRIVDQGTWDRVAASNRKTHEEWKRSGSAAFAREGGAASARRAYPLSTHLRCGLCGSAMVIQNTANPSYRCDGGRGNGANCGNTRAVKEAKLRAVIIGAFEGYFGRPEVQQALYEEAEKALADAAQEAPGELSIAKKAVADTERAIENLVDSLAGGGVAARAITKRIGEYEVELEGYKTRVRHLTASHVARRLPTPEEVVARARDLPTIFERDPRAARAALGDILDDAIVLEPLPEGAYKAVWGVRVGALLFNAEGTTNGDGKAKPPVVTEGLSWCTTPVVAGARFGERIFGMASMPLRIPLATMRTSYQ